MATAAESLGGTPVEIHYPDGVATGESAVAVDIGTAPGSRVESWRTVARGKKLWQTGEDNFGAAVAGGYLELSQKRVEGELGSCTEMAGRKNKGRFGMTSLAVGAGEKGDPFHHNEMTADPPIGEQTIVRQRIRWRAGGVHGRIDWAYGSSMATSASVPALIVAADARNFGGSAGIVIPVAAFAGLTVVRLQVVHENEIWVLGNPVRGMDAQLGRFGFTGGAANSQKRKRDSERQKGKTEEAQIPDIHSQLP